MIDNDQSIQANFLTGLFNLDEFISYPIKVVNKYFIDKGWEMVDCLNDYKWVWVNRRLNKSIIAMTEIIDDEILGNEIIHKIYTINSIYKENTIYIIPSNK